MLFLQKMDTLVIQEFFLWLTIDMPQNNQANEKQAFGLSGFLLLL